MDSQPMAAEEPVRPNVARMYDYYLGGSQNFAVDREAAEQVISIFPDVTQAAAANRAFLRRAVRHLAVGEGVRQFLDIGAGLPTQGSVHDTAAGARVVYVDHDPVAVAQSRRLLAGVETATVVHGDLRRPAEVLADPEVRRALDFAEPVAVLLVAVLHFVPDEDDPYRLVAHLREATCPGSFLALSHLTTDGAAPIAVSAGRDIYQRATSAIVPRTRAEVGRFLDGYDLLEPGLVWLSDWRPDETLDGEPASGVSHGYGAVGRKR